MARTNSVSLYWAVALIVSLALIGPVRAFGAGNIASIAKIEGQNWRHGDIEDTLLGLFMTRVGTSKKFSKLDVKRVYFGNWLRDYSQAVDVGTVKYVSAEAVRLLLWVLGFMSFGFATGEFEVTSARLGCYRPEEHIDNPKDYADNVDARQYDRRLRGPIDEDRELSIDQNTGMKAYIASEGRGITTSAGMVRDLLRKAIQLGRRSKQSGDRDEWYEALRLLGTATHCLEDFEAHSNYIELALIEMGERNVFPHVGSRTQIRVAGARDRIWPLVTGTFGGVDFLHSVCGEVSDKATQSEISELEGSISEAQQNQNVSAIKKLLDQLPSDLFGGAEKKQQVDQVQANAAAAQMENMEISPKEPEKFTRQAEIIAQQIRPVLEFHDEIMRNITEALEHVPILPELIDQLQEQVKAELETGSSEIIQGSKNSQHIVFEDDNSSDPTHSMLSKDHFSNILNEIAGKVATQVLKWAIPQIVECWDYAEVDAERTIDRIINGVFHHPALRSQGEDGARDCRQQMFEVVEQWWRQKDERERQEFRQQLSREGVQNGLNHKEGAHDTGHGCAKPLGFAKLSGGGHRNNAIAGALYSGLSQVVNNESGSQIMPNIEPQGQGSGAASRFGKATNEAAGGSVLGGVLGGIVSGIEESLLAGAFDKGQSRTESHQSTNYDSNTGGYTASYNGSRYDFAHEGRQERHGQAEYKRTDYPAAGRTQQEYAGYGESGSGQYVSEYSSKADRLDGGYQRTEQSNQYSGGEYRAKRPSSRERQDSPERSSSQRRYDSRDGRYSQDRRADDEDDEIDLTKKERKRREKEEKLRFKQEQAYEARNHDSDSDTGNKYKSKSGGNRNHQGSGYGQSNEDNYSERKHDGHGQQETGYGSYRNDYEAGHGSGDERRHRHNKKGHKDDNDDDDDIDRRRRQQQQSGDTSGYGSYRGNYKEDGYGGSDDRRHRRNKKESDDDDDDDDKKNRRLQKQQQIGGASRYGSHRDNDREGGYGSGDDHRRRRNKKDSDDDDDDDDKKIRQQQKQQQSGNTYGYGGRTEDYYYGRDK